MDNRTVRSFILGAWLLVVGASAALAAVSTDFSVAKTNDHQVKYKSSNVIYTESLAGGQWVSRSWSTDNKAVRVATSPTESLPAFEIWVKNDPAQASGKFVSNGWSWKSASQSQGPSKGVRHCVVDLANTTQPIEVKVHTLLDGTPVLERWLEISNLSTSPIALTGLSPWAGRLWSNDAPMAVGHSTDYQIAKEGWFGWTQLANGSNVFKQDKGVYADDPYFILRNDGNGEYFFGELAWPANYRMDFNKTGGLSFKVGPISNDALRVIDPGETIMTPAVHLGYVKSGFNHAVQAMHEHIRKSVLPTCKPDRSYRIQVLAPEDRQTDYKGDNFDEANLKKMIDVTAAIGGEVFIADGPTWAECTTPSTFNPGHYGNWAARKRWFPNGFGPVVDYAHSKGVLFGVYAEPEGGRGDWTQTEAYKKHPEWFVSRRPMFPGPNFINMAIPEAAAYVDSEMNEIITRHHLDLYRHDQNGVEGGEGSSTSRHGFLENDYWRHYDALYSIMDRIHKKYPDLILQEAAAGGCRLELATASRWQEHFTSDDCSYPHAYRADAGLSVFLPPEVYVVANGMAGNCKDQPDYITQVRAVYALGNTPMIFNQMLPNTVDQFDPKELDLLRHYAKLYKSFIRPMLPTMKVWHHAPVNAKGGVETGDWFAMEFTSPDTKKGWATIIRLGDSAGNSYMFKPRGLSTDMRYKVTLDNEGRSEIIDGSVLVHDGLEIKLPADAYSQMLIFEQVK